jgi:O-methyltransferase
MLSDYLLTRGQMLAHDFAARLSYGFTNYRDPSLSGLFTKVQSARSRTYTASTPLECAEIYQAVQSVEKISGPMAEVGVFRGGTAAVMLSASAKKHLHLFDTFQGLPHSEGKFKAGEYAGSVEDVRRTLAAEVARIDFHPGLFPIESADSVKDIQFSFVHLDMDLHDGTLAALEFFWPRLNPGGIVLSHDYHLVRDVSRALHEFCDGRLSPIIPLSGNQCLVVKIPD